ncbi:hypothetical protein GCM10007052_26980 [Halioglobus japonicus]|nr:hypothetical protein GCM10007052_26980 [Halioglobus japonicus]
MLATLALCFSGTVYAETYDVVISDGRVMDPETNFDEVRNVGIRDGRIIAITDTAN